MKTGKNLTISGTENDGKRHRYSFEKNEKFKIVFPELMEKLGFKKDQIEGRFVTNEDTDDGEIIIKLKISGIKDVCWFFQNKKYEIDVFFGLKKVILLIRIKSKNNREHLVNSINEMADWISEEEKQKRMKKEKIKMRQSAR